MQDKSIQLNQSTPETDALVPQFLNGGDIPDIFALCRKLERERDEAREQERIHYDNFVALKREAEPKKPQKAEEDVLEYFERLTQQVRADRDSWWRR